MLIAFDGEGSLRGLEDVLGRLTADRRVKGLMLLAAAENPMTPELLVPVLARCPLPVFGGLFPQLVFGASSYRQGTILVGLEAVPHVRLVQGLSRPVDNFDRETEGLPVHDRERPHTLFVFADGFAAGIDLLLESLFIHYGLELNYVGGGAGDLSRPHRPCVLTNAGVFADAAVVTGVPVASGVGVRHGWQPLAGPLRVTETDGNGIVSIDWQSAFEVYRRMLQQEAGQELTRENFFSVAMGYPFGISRLGAEMIIRDPLAVDGRGALLCAGHVAAGAYLYLMRGEPASLLAAAGEAHDVAQQALPPRVPYAATLLIDCISRALFLQDRFPEELAVIARGQGTLFGALTLGEIANNGRSYLEFFNKTTVVARLGRESV